jgi:hypothetical protein
MGISMMQDKRVATYSLKAIAAAQTKFTKGLPSSEYQKKLELLVSDAISIPGELSKAIAAARTEFSSKAKAGRPKAANKSKYPLERTKVGTTTGELRTPFLKLIRTGWCEGVLTAFDTEKSHPYLIEWNVDPKVCENVNEEEMQFLTHHYRECDRRRLLDIECVETEIFWTRIKDPKAKATRGGKLFCATVMYYDETLERYKLLYRDATDEWVSGYQIDEESEHLPGYTLAQKVGPIQEPWHPDVL